MRNSKIFTFILLAFICFSMFAVSVDARQYRRVGRYNIRTVPRPIVPLTQENVEPWNTEDIISYTPPLTQTEMNAQETDPLTMEDMLR